MSLLSLVAVLLLSACGSGSALPPLPESGSIGETYVLGPGDRVAIHLYGIADPNAGVVAPAAEARPAQADADSYTISNVGLIGVPLIGEVQAAGLTLAQLKTAITTRLAAEYIRNPKVGIEILAYRPFYIFGEVTRPGSYPYVDNLTVLSAVVTAGGYTHRANEDYVVIERKINGKPIQGTATTSTAIRPDDIVRIPERFF